MYLTLSEFEQRLPALTALTGGEYKRSLVQTALKQAHAALDAELSRRYTLPLPSDLPDNTKELLKRWVFYLAVRELLGLQGVSVEREQQPILSDLFELVDEQIRNYTQGNAVLMGVPPRIRVLAGFGTLVSE